MMTMDELEQGLIEEDLLIPTKFSIIVYLQNYNQKGHKRFDDTELECPLFAKPKTFFQLLKNYKQYDNVLKVLKYISDLLTFLCQFKMVGSGFYSSNYSIYVYYKIISNIKVILEEN